MKMTTKIMMVLLTVISTVTFAKTNDSVKNDATVRVVTGTASGSYKLIYRGDEEQVEFKLLNSQGDILTDKRIQVENGFIQPVDLSKLPSGDYTFVVENGDGSIAEFVNHTSAQDVELEQLRVNRLARKVRYEELAAKIQFDQVSDQIEVTGIDLDEKLNLKVYDDQDNLVHSNRIEAANFDQIFDFENTGSRWVRFVVVGKSKVVADQKFSLN